MPFFTPDHFCWLVYHIVYHHSLHAYIYISPDRDARSVFVGSCPSCTQIRLADGCSGTLEVLTEQFGYGTATDLNFGDEEAQVVCRQLGCFNGNGTGPERTFTDE